MNTVPSLRCGLQRNVDDADQSPMTDLASDVDQVAAVSLRPPNVPPSNVPTVNVDMADVLQRATTGLATVLMGLLPFHLYFALGGDGNPVVDPLLSLQDLVIIPMAIFGSAVLGRRFVSRTCDSKLKMSPVTVALYVFWAAVTVSTLMHPTARGVLHVLRLLAVPVLVELCTRRTMRDRLVIVAACSVSFSAGVAIVQRLLAGPVGLFSLGERGDPFLSLVPGFPTPTAFTGHPYHAGTMFIGALGALSSVALRRKIDLRWSAPVALLAFAGAQSSSRMLIVALVGLGVVLAAAATRRVTRRSALILLASVAVPTVAWVAAQNGSYSRPRPAGSERTIESLANGRGELLDQSIAIWKSAPLTGVGPGNYVAAQRELGLSQIGPWPIVVHSFPLQVLSESGLVGLAGLLGAVGTLAWSARRRFISAMVPLSVAAPMALLDHAMWTFGFATVVLAMLIGTASAP
jgi:O-antigen ligase